MRSVLIIEDNAAMLRGLRDSFAAEGFRVSTAADGERGLEAALSLKPDLIVLDLMLPKVNGYEICRHLRAEGVATPIIMLTARTGESDVVLGLNLGADDYVTKPFGIRELLARSHALLRRGGGRSPEETAGVFRFGECELALPARRLLRRGAEVKLSPREFDLLAYLVQKSGVALSRDRILHEVWGYDQMVTPRSVDRFITVLRQKVEPDPQHPQFIQTVREFGYKFQPSPVASAPPEPEN